MYAGVTFEGTIRTAVTLTVDLEWAYTFPSEVVLDRTLWGAYTCARVHGHVHAHARVNDRPVTCTMRATCTCVGWGFDMLGFSVQAGVYLRVRRRTQA
jgi:hypothetical protein